jgi:hypothetical protein
MQSTLGCFATITNPRNPACALMIGGTPALAAGQTAMDSPFAVPALPTSLFAEEQVVGQPTGPPPTPRHTGVRALFKDLGTDVKHLPSKENLFWAAVGGDGSDPVPRHQRGTDPRTEARHSSRASRWQCQELIPVRSRCRYIRVRDGPRASPGVERRGAGLHLLVLRGHFAAACQSALVQRRGIWSLGRHHRRTNGYATWPRVPNRGDGRTRRCCRHVCSEGTLADQRRGVHTLDTCEVS